MNLKNLNVQVLEKEQLQKITAGAQPDCEGGEVLQYVPGFGWVCVPSFCAWEIPADADL